MSSSRIINGKEYILRHLRCTACTSSHGFGYLGVDERGKIEVKCPVCGVGSYEITLDTIQDSDAIYERMLELIKDVYE